MDSVRKANGNVLQRVGAYLQDKCFDELHNQVSCKSRTVESY